MTMNDDNGRELANGLVRYFGARVGVRSARLNEHGDRSFGEFGFHFDPQNEILTARVFVADAYLRGDHAHPKQYFAILDTLNGLPRERAGGKFELDEGQEMFFLVRNFPVHEISPEVFGIEMERLINTGAKWTMEWFLEAVDAAKIALSASVRARQHGTSLRLSRLKSSR